MNFHIIIHHIAYTYIYIYQCEYRIAHSAEIISTVVWVAQHWALGCCVKKVVADATFSDCSGSGAISSSGHGVYAVVARQP